MSKKDFTGGLSSLLGEAPEEPKARKGRPKTQFKKITKSTQQGTQEGETRATFIVNEKLLEKVQAVAYWDRVLIKEVINKALQEAVNKYEKTNGAIQPKPNK
jgi:hypothetical protein